MCSRGKGAATRLIRLSPIAKVSTITSSLIGRELQKRPAVFDFNRRLILRDQLVILPTRPRFGRSLAIPA